MEHAGFPSDETLAAYIDGRLDAKTRRRVIEHIDQCEECYAVVLSANEFRSEEGITPEATASRRLRQRWIAVAVAAAALAAVIVAIGPVRAWLRHRPAVGTALLAQSVGEHRHIQPRLAGFPWQSFQAMRGPEELTKNPENWRLVAAAARVHEEASRHRTPETLHALGVSHLLYGNFDEAVATLGQAVEMESGAAKAQGAILKSKNVHLLIDLAAAYEARAAQKGAPRDHYIACEVIDRASKLAPRSPEVLWNRALAIEGTNLNEDAAAAWEAYLRVDPSSRWSNEAREHLRHLRVPTTSELWERERPQLAAAAVAGRQERVNEIVARFPYQSRSWGEKELLPEWGKTRSRDALATARAIGKALDHNTGERMLADSVMAVDRAHGRALDALAEGHVAYAAGHQSFEHRDINNAITQFDTAIAKLDEGGSALAAFARVHRAACHFMRNHYDPAVTELLRVKRSEKGRRHLALLARADWLYGLIEGNLGRPNEACDLYQQSLDAFATLHEEDNVAAIDGLMGDVLELTGDIDDALGHEARALSVLAKTGSRFRFHRLLATAAHTAAQQQYTAVAELMLNRLAQFDAKNGMPGDTCETCLMLGLTRAGRGDRAGAANAIRTADKYCRSMPDEAQRQRLASYAVSAIVASGAMPIPHTPEALTRAINFYHSSGSRVALAQLYAERGEVWREQGRLDRAESDFERSLEELEAEHSRALDGFLAVEPPFDSMLRLLIAQHRYGDALLVADRSNALRVSTLGVAASATHFTSAVSIQSMLPEDVVVAAYHVSSDALLIWIVARDRLDFHAIRMNADNIRTAVTSIASSASTAPTPEILRPAARNASGLLLASWLDSIRPGATIVFVPDGVVDDVPFAALMDPGTNRFLIQEHPIATSSSIATFAHCLTVDRARRDNSDALFASPAPAQMARLPFSEREIEDASSFWARHTLLHGGGATKHQFLDRARRAAIIHFAGHAKINDRAPMMSALVFPDSLLYMHELSAKAFEHARLFILAACSTGRQARPGMSFAAALGAQSVPSVVASLWDADDRSSAALFTVFHRELRRGAGRAAALQRAQLSLLFAADPDLRKPASWAGFQLIGAVEPIVQEEKTDV